MGCRSRDASAGAAKNRPDSARMASSAEASSEAALDVSDRSLTVDAPASRSLSDIVTNHTGLRSPHWGGA